MSPSGTGGVPVLPAGWVYADLSPFGGGLPLAVLGTRAGFVAVADDSDGPWTLTSSDGVTWRRGAEPPGLPPSPPDPMAAGLYAVVSGIGRYALLGTLGAPTSTWYRLSEDGRNWSVPDPGFPEGEDLFHLTGSGQALYAITWRAGNREASTLWQSTDGHAWARVTDAPALAAAAQAEDKAYVLMRVVISGDRLLVFAAENWQLGDEGSQGRVWVTSDLESWTWSGPAEPFLAATTGGPAIVPIGDGFGVYAWDADAPIALVTRDGVEWERHTLGGLDVEELGSVTPADGGYLDLFHRYDPDGRVHAGAAVSDDGLAWRGKETLGRVLDPARGSVWTHGGALGNGRLVIWGAASVDPTLACDGGECPPVLLAGPVPDE